MDLHQAAARPDWATVPVGKQNLWQQVASRTRGIVTPGNTASVTGTILVLVGLRDVAAGHLWRSLILIGLGRLFDIADGYLASKTGTKSPLGEAVDATCDKICAFATILIFATNGVLWWPAAVLFGGQNLVNTFIGLVAKRRKYNLHPLASGKIATIGVWMALLGLGLTAALSLEQTSALGVAAYSVLAVSLGIGLYATVQYVRTFLRKKLAR